jgi:tetratricopeptide (TPR) repeat protein/2-polyprenyl-3-methyl-5-hydroxy-6-metoxy-1,4-benzoquinol methylase
MTRRDRRATDNHSGSLPSHASTLFALAVRHHQAGQLIEAENIYRQVLTSDSEHFGSLHHLGIIALQKGQAQAAIDVISRALAANDRVPDCHYNMAFALQALGRLNESVGYYRHAIELKPDYVEAHTNLGNALKELGSHREAAACYERVVALKPSAEAHYNLANAQSHLGHLSEAVTSYQRALALKPDLVGAHNNLANALVAHGRPDEALIHFQRALELDPNLLEAHVNLGAILLQQGKLDAAAIQLEHALSIDVNSADAQANLGNVRLAQGHLAEAEQCYRRALALRPEAAELDNNLGVVLAALGDFEEAGRRFHLALARKPDFIDAHENLARVFLSMGQPGNALVALQRALAVCETTQTKSLFVQCLRVLPALPDFTDLRSLLIRALSESWGRANDMAAAAARMVKLDGAIRPIVAGVLEAEAQQLPADGLLDAAALAAVSGDRLLRCLLQSTAIVDIELERVLTAFRRALLKIVAASGDASVVDERLSGLETLDFCCALARQCFLNEQIFACAEEELDEARRLRDRVTAALASGGAIAELQLAVVAAYFPLHSLAGAESLLHKTWSDAVGGVLVQQVREPADEQILRASIPVLTPVENDISRKVQQQYEENPYPRWAQAEPPGQPLLFDQYLRRRLPAAHFRNLGKPQVDTLIAGCGTGQHAIETAQRFVGASVLAVDLSLASISYAKRKTIELGLSNIEYGQADILKLGSLGRTFDLIESSGVLHHLADPFAGWRVLLSLLRPGGFMMIGLYSEIARAEIVKTRAFIAEQGYGATAGDIRECRQALIAGGKEFSNVIASGDFFSTSGCRDLLFHVQEHRFSIPEIAGFIAQNGLEFVGFDLDHFTLRRYITRFPRDTAMSDLASWEMFELAYPSTFSGMYQFWVQKTP